ncbi:hypothetical protein RHO13_05760 [Orbus wheelerorum]|uniref:hypothetical protein n=1 Tax=Orbus wheelerorum TaxID=3074111 RepID=UPI00370DCEF3
MTKKLTDKQLKTLREFSHPDLLNQLIKLIDNHPDIQKIIVSQWLAPPANQIKTLTKSYTRLFKKITSGTRFYSYHDTDRVFAGFDIDFNQPLKALAADCPSDVVKLTYKMIDEFDTLCSNMDTSSGSWYDCYLALYHTLFISLIHLPQAEYENTVDLLFYLSQNDPSFQWDNLIQKEVRLPKTLLIDLRDKLLVHQLIADAFSLSVILHDIPAAQALYNKCPSTLSLNYQLELASILIEDLDTKQAISILHNIQPKIQIYQNEYKQWTELMSLAYRDNGEIGKAKTVILDSFKHSPLYYYWQLYLKICQTSQDLPEFINLVKEKGLNYLIEFLFELNDYQSINAIFEKQIDKIDALVDQLDTSFCRKLSTTLNKNGSHLIAILLRRQLAERTIKKAQSRYYKYAVSDIKKQIDYAIEAHDEKIINDSFNWIKALYNIHYRKTSLWYEVEEKIPQLKFTLK